MVEFMYEILSIILMVLTLLFAAVAVYQNAKQGKLELKFKTKTNIGSIKDGEKVGDVSYKELKLFILNEKDTPIKNVIVYFELRNAIISIESLKNNTVKTYNVEEIQDSEKWKQKFKWIPDYNIVHKHLPIECDFLHFQELREGAKIIVKVHGEHRNIQKYMQRIKKNGSLMHHIILLLVKQIVKINI
jgi:hypothetical protein